MPWFYVEAEFDSTIVADAQQQHHQAAEAMDRLLDLEATEPFRDPSTASSFDTRQVTVGMEVDVFTPAQAVATALQAIDRAQVPGLRLASVLVTPPAP